MASRPASGTGGVRRAFVMLPCPTPRPSVRGHHGERARYRARAEEVRKRAVASKWAEVRANLLQAAETYDALAQTIEDIAERQARPWTLGEGGGA